MWIDPIVAFLITLGASGTAVAYTCLMAARARRGPARRPTQV